MARKVDWVFFCDGDDRAGLGHVGRCLGYAELLSEAGYNCSFSGRFGAQAATMIANAGFEGEASLPIGEMPPTHFFRLRPAEGVVVDSYNVGAGHFSKLRSAKTIGTRLVVIDDFAAHDFYDCDAVINFTVGASRLPYPAGPEIRYLGPEYFPARRWLRRARQNSARLERLPSIDKLLIVPGSRGITDILRVFLLMLTFIHFRTDVVVVTNDPQALAVLESVCLEHKLGTFKVVPTQPDLEHWFEWADACFCGGGLIKYECLYAGIPVLSISQNEGQAVDSQQLAEAGAITNLGLVSEVDPTKVAEFVENFLCDAQQRTKMVAAGRLLVGGKNGLGGLVPFLSTKLPADVS